MHKRPRHLNSALVSTRDWQTFVRLCHFMDYHQDERAYQTAKSLPDNILSACLAAKPDTLKNCIQSARAVTPTTQKLMLHLIACRPQSLTDNQTPTTTSLLASNMRAHNNVFAKTLVSMGARFKLADLPFFFEDASLHPRIFAWIEQVLTAIKSPEMLTSLSKALAEIPPSADRQKLEQMVETAGLSRRFQHDLLFHYALHNDARDLFIQFTDTVLVPAYSIMTQQERATELLKAHEWRVLLHATIHQFIAREMAEGKSFSTILADIDGLSRSWHHPSVALDMHGAFHPDDMPKPRDANQPEAWHPLIEPYSLHSVSGHKLVAATDRTMLKEASDQLDHCVGRHTHYGSDCLDGKHHIIFELDAQNRHVSTLQVKLWKRKDDTKELPENTTRIGQSDEYLTIVSHRGVQNATFHDSPVRNEFLACLKDGTLPVNQARGSLDGRNFALPEAIKRAGYYPTWENVARAFQDFKRPMRRSALGRDANNDLIYDDRITDDNYRHSVHFIDGHVRDRSRITAIFTEGADVSLRHMNIREWLHATGMEEVLNSLAHRRNTRGPYIYHPQPPETGGFKATQPPPPPLPPSRQYAMQAGTLSRHHLASLSPVERRSYLTRLEEQRIQHKNEARSAYLGG